MYGSVEDINGTVCITAVVIVELQGERGGGGGGGEGREGRGREGREGGEGWERNSYRHTDQVL